MKNACILNVWFGFTKLSVKKFALKTEKGKMDGRRKRRNR